MLSKTSLEGCLLDSVKEVFETMIFMDIEPSDESEHILEGPAFMGLISFSGDVEGCLGVCCTSPCAATIAANMLGSEPGSQTSEQDMKDAIGEVANMILGSFKTRAESEMGNLQVSVPTVICGRELNNDMIARSEKVLLKINLQGEYFAELTLLYRQSGK
jgi:chemotaxis protein CheX